MMPNRMIRESALTSETLEALSSEAERLWWRLTLVADDYGRFNADPRIIASGCFPLRRGLRADRVERWLQNIISTGAIMLYLGPDKRRYGVFLNWSQHQRPRDSKPKFPAPPEPTGQTPGVEGLSVPYRGGSRQVAASGGEVPPGVGGIAVAVGIDEGIAGDGDGRQRRSSGVTRTPTGFTVPDYMLALWAKAYPGVQITTEIQAAFAWEQAHPERRKVNLAGFLVRWLKKAQNQAVRVGSARPRDRPSVPLAQRAAEIVANVGGVPRDTRDVRQDSHPHRAVPVLPIHTGGTADVVGAPGPPGGRRGDDGDG